MASEMPSIGTCTTLAINASPGAILKKRISDNKMAQTFRCSLLCETILEHPLFKENDICHYAAYCHKYIDTNTNIYMTIVGIIHLSQASDMRDALPDCHSLSSAILTKPSRENFIFGTCSKNNNWASSRELRCQLINQLIVFSAITGGTLCSYTLIITY
jgi:hypothetical protein